MALACQEEGPEFFFPILVLRGMPDSAGVLTARPVIAAERSGRMAAGGETEVYAAAAGWLRCPQAVPGGQGEQPAPALVCVHPRG
jgi:hypothetical protein